MILIKKYQGVVTGPEACVPQVSIDGQHLSEAHGNITTASGHQDGSISVRKWSRKITGVVFARSGHGRIVWVKRLSSYGSFSNPQMTIEKAL
jgi:hypothetical protein